jgi:DNA relaxase NicK
LTIGSRSSSNYYRVYQKNNGLEFELEIKNKVIKSFQDLLFSDRIEEFEDRLAKHFY